MGYSLHRFDSASLFPPVLLYHYTIIIVIVKLDH